jgi:penicillin-binding protein-related factor A (putative recombinase)
MNPETATQNRLRIEAATHGVILWRNNVGVLKDIKGRAVRFGLANDSERLNAKLKSSDLIGIYQGKFCAFEVKNPGWKYSGKGRERAQLRFIDLVKAQGGIAGFVTCWDDMSKLLGYNGIS